MMELTCLLLLIGMVILTTIRDLAYQRYLLLKAEKENRTAICIKDKFFYIVPEAEYCNLTMDSRLLQQYRPDLAERK